MREVPQGLSKLCGRGAHENGNTSRSTCLLRPHRHRPGSRRAAQQRDELAASDESRHLLPQPQGLRGQG